MKIIRTTTVFLLAMALTLSCNSGNEKNNDSKSASNSLEEVIKAADAISPEINNVNDIFQTLDLVEAGYYPILCNDPYSATSYLNSKPVASANLGVYVTDIVYHMYGEATKDMYISFSAAQELARYIGLESKFAATLLTELEGSDISRDSLLAVFNGLMEDSEKYGSAKEMAYVHTAFLTGLYIEKIFITSSLLDQSFNKEEKSEQDIVNSKKLLVVFQNQLGSLDALMASLKGKYKHIESIIDAKEIKDLKESSTALNSEVDELLSAEEPESSEQIISLHKQITAVRNRIISAS